MDELPPRSPNGEGPPEREGDSQPQRVPVFNLPTGILVALVGLGAIYAVQSLLLSNFAAEWLAVNFGFSPLRYVYPLSEQGYEWLWTPVTYSFLHGSLEHLAFNGLWLAAFGTPVLRRIGNARFAAFWIVSAAAGAAVHAGFNWGQPTIMIGACERSGFFIYASPITAAISMLAFALIIPEGAGLGSAWARTGVHGIWLVWLIGFCWMRLSIRLNLTDLLLIAFAALVCAAVAYGILQEIQGFGGMLLAVACGALVYAVAIRLLGVVPRNDVVALATNLPAKLPPRLSDLVYRLLLLLVPARRSDG